MFKKLIVLNIILIPCLSFAQINVSNINKACSKLKILAVNNDVYSEDNYSQADTGKKFISVKVILDNTKSHSKTYSSFFNFVLRDSNNNLFKPSIKSFVVRQPYLASTIIEPGKTTKGWVTFEVPQKISVDSLQIRYKLPANLCSNWIPLWSVVSNCDEIKKLKTDVSRRGLNSFSNMKKLALIKTLQSINNYIKYTTTSQINFVVEGIKNASQAKLLIDAYKKTHDEPINQKLSALNKMVAMLSKNIPENIIKQHPLKDVRSLTIYLKKMKNAIAKNYIAT